MTVYTNDRAGRSGMRDLSVLHVGPGHGQRGGIASVLGELATQQAAFSNDAIRIAFFETHGFQRVGSAARFVMLDFPRFVPAVRQADIVHFHVSERGSLYRKLLLCAFAKLARKRVVFHLHSGNFEQFAARSGALTRTAIRWFVGHADAAIGVSAACARVLNRFREKATDARVIANSAAEAQREPREANTATPAFRPYVAFAGRLSQQKGVGTLIDALALLAAQGDDVDLFLAGEGDVEHWHAYAAARGVADRVRFVGWLDGADKARFIQRASVFCLPSRFEAFGIAVLEAMFHGVPVVATRVGGLVDLVDDGVTGCLVTPDDTGALADSLHDLVRNPALRERLGSAGRERAHRLYAIETITSQYVDCYREITGRT